MSERLNLPQTHHRAQELIVQIDELRAERDAARAERDKARSDLLELAVQVSLLRDAFNIARWGISEALQWVNKGRDDADRLWEQHRPRTNENDASRGEP